MYEVEVKVPAAHDPVRAGLDALGADRLGVVTQVDTYYDHPTRSFAATDEALRIRREADRDVLTYKGPKVDEASKTRREIETVLEDGQAMDAILTAIGFEPAAEVRKTRERYAIDDFTIGLDAVEGLGQFVEVEADADLASIDALRDGAYRLLERLGLDAEDQVRKSYLELLTDARE